MKIHQRGRHVVRAGVIAAMTAAGVAAAHAASERQFPYVSVSGVTQAPIICDLTGDNLEILKERTNTLLNGKAKFEGAQSTVGSPGLTLIFHPNFNRGETVLGWISQYEVPEHMTVEATLERLKEAAA